MSRLFQLTGPNGCGKTSALRVLGRSPQLAQSLFALPSLSDLSIRSTAIGFQAGQNVIFSRSVRSLVITPLVFAGITAAKAAARVREVLQRFQFEYVLDRDYLTLSGGERQFVALFSCLLSQVDLYLLDDPVVMMDNERGAEILKVISECKQTNGRTAYGVTCVRPEYYANLTPDDTVHLGYSPDPSRCLEEFNGLIQSLKGADKGRLDIVLNKVTIAPYGRVLLRDANEHWCSGKVVLITGGNGMGKTCLLQTIAGILEPRSGSVCFVSGQSSSQRAEIGKNCFYLPQQFTSLLGFDMVSQELGTEKAPAWWKEILTFIYDWRILNPDLRVPESSLGERHFCNILAAISALARNPLVAALLLDEPDSGLDVLRSQLLTRFLAWLAAQNYFVAIVSHHPGAYRETGNIPLQLQECTIVERQLALGKQAGE